MRTCFLLIFLIFFVHISFGQTYAEVQPIITAKCVTCHRNGGDAPFSLETYLSLKKRTSFIKQVIETNYMPPWRADSHYRDFANNRSLTTQEKETILSWIANNAPEGKPAKKINNEIFSRTPDLILKINAPFQVKGMNEEKFVVFKIPFEIADTQNIEGIELYANNKKIIHHLNYGFYAVPDKTVDLKSGPAVIDTDIDTAGLEARYYGPFKKSMIYYSGWIPGTTNEFYPKQFGWVLPKRGVLIMTVHYSAIGAPEESMLGVKLFFKKQAVERNVRIISLGSGGIGERDITPKFLIFPKQLSTFRLKVKTQETQSIMCVWPHMHYLGKEFYAYAVTPDNDTINLVHIPEWDFRWQELYRMKKLIRIPAGSVINMIGVYDNTADNPSNPNNPPKIVFSTGNMRASDEMFTLLMIYLPYQEGDENISLN
ncbi:hypothetical protein SAMN05518672_104324 [Chitinophaga sp. CF118]|uniref:calcium-binding protein n=1 Tax=Chitinophaga sp. CF118 TaxID=1884367 RepID=UPI0008F2AD2A|nr:calcium-binding protein [Chitinophaga sp. CF118]SFE06066.1 hypothetical protein SAMN05518672_104324 [Chitinophaga sp. CF118]